MNLKSRLRVSALRAAYAHLEKAPEANVHRLLEAVQELVGRDKPAVQAFLTSMRSHFKNPEDNWYRCYCALWRRVSPACMRRLFEVGVIEAGVLGAETRRERAQTLDCVIPWGLRLAAGEDVSAAALDAAVCQGLALGVGAFVLEAPQGVRRELLTLCFAHPQTLFFVFTPASAVNEAAAAGIARVGNLIPVLGTAAAQDEAADRAAALLRARGLLYADWCRCTIQTAGCLADGTLPDACIARGAAFLWLTDETGEGETPLDGTQRAALCGRLRAFRAGKPLPILGMWDAGSSLGALLSARCPRVVPGTGRVEDVLRRRAAD